MSAYIVSIRAFLLTPILYSILFLSPGYANAAGLAEEAEDALKKKDFPRAEALFIKALEQEPDNFKSLQSLVEVKTAQGKYNEADQILTRILSIPIASGRNALVTLEGVAEPVEAEVVDENVFAPLPGKDNVRNYVDPAEEEPVPQYRLFFKKTGELKLVPKSQAKLKYTGVPILFHEKMQFLQTEVRRKILASAPQNTDADPMVEIKGGCFLMGANKGHPDEMPIHEVCIASFKMDKYEVKQSAFQAKMGSNPARFVGANLPVDSATWDEALEYCQKSGKRLPTEAEWEYAARAGTKTEYYTGDTITGKDANFCDSTCNYNLRDPKTTDGFQYTAPAGSFPPNPFGLYDMAGNLSEWVSDWLDENYYQFRPKDNPKGPEYADSKVFRGGAWNGTVEMLRSAKRMGFWPGYRYEEIGFRCAMDLSELPKK